MTWSFQRADDVLYVEALYDADSRAYLLRWRFADGSKRGELFTNVFTFRERLLTAENELRRDGWTQVGPAVFLSDGWRVK